MTGSKAEGLKAYEGRLAPMALLVLLAVLALALASGHLYSVRQSRDWVDHSYRVIDATRGLFSLVQDVEAGERGYMATNDARFLDNYDASRAQIPASEAHLRDLVRDNADQAARVRAVEDLVDRRVTVAERRVELARSGRMDLARTVQFGEGQAAMGALRGDIQGVIDAENALLAQRARRAASVDLTGYLVGLLLAGSAIAGLGVMTVSVSGANRRLRHEVGEREAAEGALRESEARYRAVFRTTADLLYVLDVTPDGRYVMAEVNPAYERAVGASLAQLRGLDVEVLAGEARGAQLVRHLDAVCAVDHPLFSRDHVFLPQGERIWESLLTAVRGADGRGERIVGSSRDVTDRERAQEQMRRGQRLEAIGQLTGGIAHDFNNLLQVIRGNLELISSQVGEGPSAPRVRNALHAAERAAQLTRQLLAFARRQPLEPRVIHLGRLIGDMTEILRRTLGERMQVETRIAEDLWNTSADPAQVESAVLNLAINARDAMADGGRLTIALENTSVAAGADGELERGDYVLISVSDTGCGMDKETLKRVFEPFFTTKGAEKGTGLGLSMVYGFVKQSRGHVQMFSAPGEGATVKIYLPRSLEAVEEASEAPAGALHGSSEVILVVEDDDMVRASAVGILREHGYTCIHAPNGAAALNMLESGARIDLLFTDVVMPGPVTCRDLAREAQALRPGLPVLYTSGYAEDAIVHDGRVDEGVQLLSKPYDRETLARRISAMLKAARPVVLVVEDDPLVRMAAVDMVEALGFTPLQAGDAPSAMEILRRKQPVDVLFTDIGLPGVRGTELAQQARAMRPELKVIFASGYGDSEDLDDGLDASHLRKPYEQDQLAEALTSAVH